MKPKNQRPKPTVNPATAQTFERLKTSAGARGEVGRRELRDGEAAARDQQNRPERTNGAPTAVKGDHIKRQNNRNDRSGSRFDWRGDDWRDSRTGHSACQQTAQGEQKADSGFHRVPE
jgi:hypothetical protein